MQVSTCWTEPLAPGHSLAILSDLASRHALMGGEHGQNIYSLIKDCDWAALCSYELPVNTCGWNLIHLINCRQALGFFQKLEFIDIGVDKEQVAYSKFVQSESRCRDTNRLLRGLLRGSVNCRPRDILVLDQARRKIRTILGPCPRFEDLNFRLGPGATTSLKRSQCSPQRKFAQGFSCSDNLLHSGYLPSLIRELPVWASAHASGYSIDDDGYLVETVPVTLSPGRLEFVPKNAKTYRSIVVEPILNSTMQLGLGDYMSARLRRAGVDIRDQSRNALLARRGSITGNLSTLDLSSASDTVSYELVKFLLPEGWFRLLNACRSASVIYDGVEHHLEKFSSMGNGFTFPLETLIFYALTVAACGSSADLNDIGVYGDDIICPSGQAHDVIRALTFCGFEVNNLKSFCEGPFRESCGHDYYLGIDVRPFYQKHLVSGLTLFTLHNFYYRRGDSEGAELVKKRIPRPLRIFGPDGYGDGHLLSDVWPRDLSPKLRAKGYAGVQFDTFSLSARREKSRYPGDYVSPLYSIYRKEMAPCHELFPSVLITREQRFAKDGRPLWDLPGFEGYSRTSIYTLAA